MSTKNVDDLISGPAYDKPKDEIQEYYTRIRERSHAIWEIREKARELGAPKKVMDALEGWWDRESNTGD